MCAKYVVIAVDVDDAPPTCVMRGIEGARLTHQTSACAQYYCGGPLWGFRPKFGACRHLVPAVHMHAHFFGHSVNGGVHAGYDSRQCGIDPGRLLRLLPLGRLFDYDRHVE